MAKWNLVDFYKRVWDEGYRTGFKHAVIFCDAVLGIVVTVLLVVWWLAF